MKKVIFIFVFIYTSTGTLLSQMSISTGILRITEGAQPNTERFSSSKDQLFINDYLTVKLDYKKKRIGAFLETLYLSKSTDLHQHSEQQYGSGSSGYFNHINEDKYSNVSFSYLGFKGGADLILGNISPINRFNAHFYISLFNQFDFLTQFSQTDQVQYRTLYYTTLNNSSNVNQYTVYPAEYSTMKTINFSKFYYQCGLEFRSRLNYSNFFLELTAGAAIINDYRVFIHGEPNIFLQNEHIVYNSSLKLGYVFSKRE